MTTDTPELLLKAQYLPRELCNFYTTVKYHKERMLTLFYETVPLRTPTSTYFTIVRLQCVEL